MSEIKYSVIIPAHNEGKSIVELINRVKKIMLELKEPFEIIIVNDNSTDDSEKILSELNIPELKVINRKKFPGVGFAKREGFNKAKGEIFITMDGDLSHLPEQIPILLKELKNNDIVCGSRYLKNNFEQEMNFSRKIISNLFNLFFGTLIGLPIKDFTSGFRVIKRKVFDSIKLTSKNFGIYIEIPIKAYLKGFKLTEIPIKYSKAKSESNLNYLKQGPEYIKIAMYAVLKKRKIELLFFLFVLIVLIILFY